MSALPLGLLVALSALASGAVSAQADVTERSLLIEGPAERLACVRVEALKAELRSLGMDRHIQVRSREDQDTSIRLEVIGETRALGQLPASNDDCQAITPALVLMTRRLLSSLPPASESSVAPSTPVESASEATGAVPRAGSTVESNRAARGSEQARAVRWAMVAYAGGPGGALGGWSAGAALGVGLQRGRFLVSLAPAVGWRPPHAIAGGEVTSWSAGARAGFTYTFYRLGRLQLAACGRVQAGVIHVGAADFEGSAQTALRPMLSFAPLAQLSVDMEGLRMGVLAGVDLALLRSRFFLRREDEERRVIFDSWPVAPSVELGLEKIF